MVFLGPFGPLFYELRNFVKILDPHPLILKNFQSETWKLCEFFLNKNQIIGNFRLDLAL